MVDQFQPWFFGVAFAFLFKFCTGMPDLPQFAEKERFRRAGDAPRIEAPLWVRAMARRVEAQVSRDWHFGFVTWNYLFRSAVNLSRNLYSYESAANGACKGFTADELQEGAIAICKATFGKYQDLDGRTEDVRGDMTKVRYVPGLSPAAKRLLQNLEHTSRRIAGTQETRRLMRFNTHANRVRYGVPIFVTFSPDEAHRVSMLRLSRTRRNDPVFAEGHDAVGARLCGRRQPSLNAGPDDVVLGVPMEELRGTIPGHDERRAMLARDALATVDGFRVIVAVTYEHLFGVRMCRFCSDCNNGQHGRPFQDLFGNSSTPEGGIFGRCDAGYTSIEAQKSRGSLHAHSQLFIECLHQHTPLIEVLRSLRSGGNDLVRRYLMYKEHVSRQVYADAATAQDRLPGIETAWPEYAESTLFVSRPGYLSANDEDGRSTESTLADNAALPSSDGDAALPSSDGAQKDGICTESMLADNAALSSSDGDAALPSSDGAQKPRGDSVRRAVEEGRAWLRSFLGTDVEALQLHKQHHVHTVNAEGERVPFSHCRRKDNPKLCKADFPRTKWLIDRAVVLCQGLIRRMGMAASGRRSKLGSLHGPMNHESLNATHPAMLAAHRFNGDVQLPYRLPICAETHDCEEDCVEQVEESVIVEAAQVAQDAQAGYACDYCNKRQPMAFNEVKECCKGHRDLKERVAGQGIEYVGKRHATRLLCDAYGKGIVRGQAENANLRAYAKENDVTHSETFRTCQTETFYGREYLSMIELLNDNRKPEYRATFPEVDARNPRRRKVTIRDVATLHGQRPRRPEVWYLSPYEFVTRWEAKLPPYSRTLEEDGRFEHHARLTETGKEALEVAKNSRRGPFLDLPSTQGFRHTWILVRRHRPKAPSFAGAPLPRHRPGEQKRSGAIVLAYFHPWTLRLEDAEEHVPHAGRLRRPKETWEEALATWLSGNILCGEAARYVGNSLSVCRVRPADDGSEQGNSDDMVSDEELHVSTGCLKEALVTRIGGRNREEDDEAREAAEGGATHYANSRAAMELGEEIWKARASKSSSGVVPEFPAPADLGAIIAGAAASQRQEHGLSAALKEAERAGAVTRQRKGSAADAEKWLSELKARVGESGRPVANAGQYEAVSVVAKRVVQELRAQEDLAAPVGEPLRWCFHGGPGTGKSHAIKLVKELFTEALGWSLGVEFHIVALQAVMADQLGGDTIHHACGIPE